MAVDKDLLELDLYGLLGVGEKASEKEIKKAYRQKALTCHPDKNPDNPRAAEVFHQLSQALAVLTDAAARVAYDKVRKAKKQAAERTQKLDEKRKKVKLGNEIKTSFSLGLESSLAGYLHFFDVGSHHELLHCCSSAIAFFFFLLPIQYSAGAM
uniref:DnaJ homolog subfamily C member 17 n=1 Tax=Chrysolophus pictus TaxID=9089 RepID=A0A8C3KW41_CHRPC